MGLLDYYRQFEGMSEEEVNARLREQAARERGRALARRHGVAEERIAIGHGAADLLAAAARTLLEPGDELVTPWPSFPLYPLMAPPAQGGAGPRARLPPPRTPAAGPPPPRGG